MTAKSVTYINAIVDNRHDEIDCTFEYLFEYSLPDELDNFIYDYLVSGNFLDSPFQFNFMNYITIHPVSYNQESS